MTTSPREAAETSPGPRAAAGAASETRPGRRVPPLDLVALRLQVWAVTRWAALPRWGQALVVFVGCQLLTALMLERAARFTQADAEGRIEQRSYLSFVARWDSAWYRKAAQDGYPEVLPRGDDGRVEQNTWAFYPLFPMLARALSGIGIGWPLGGWLVAVAAAVGAAVLLRSLVDRLAGPSVALWSVALLAAFPTAPSLQFPYTESLGLLLLLAVLLALQRRRYLTAIPLVALVGLTRPIALPLVGVVAVHLALRLRRRARLRRAGHPDPAPRGELVRLVALLGATGVAAVTWPVVAWAVTGERTAYTDTMAAWRGSREVTPLRPWLDTSERYLGAHLGPALLVVAALALVAWLTRRRAARLGADLRVWSVCYVAYLFLVLDPTTSLARYLLLLFPLGVLALLASPSLAYRRALLGASFLLQLVWIVTIWRTGFSPP